MTPSGLQNAAAVATLVTCVATCIYMVATVLMLWVLWKTARYAKGQWDSAENARQLSCLRDLSDKWSSALIRAARQIIERETQGAGQLQWRRPADAKKLDEYFELIALANFFEDMGLLEKEGQLTLAQVKDRFSSTILYYRGVLVPFIDEQQKEDPSVLSNFTALARKLGWTRSDLDSGHHHDAASSG